MRRLCLLLLAVALLAIVFCSGAYYIEATEAQRLRLEKSQLRTELLIKTSKLRIVETRGVLLEKDNTEMALALHENQQELKGTVEELAVLKSIGDHLTCELANCKDDVAVLVGCLSKYSSPYPPSEFASLDSLKEWLANDDTDMQIPILPNRFDCDDYAYLLAHRAWQDGYIISPYFNVRRTHAMNTTKIGRCVYLIEPQTDYVTFWGVVD